MAYKNTRNQVNGILGKAHQDYCSHLFQIDDTFTDNHERLVLDQKNKKNYQPVVPLHMGKSLKSTPLSKAEALDQQTVCSVFTKENNDILIMNSTAYPAMNNIVFSVNGIKSLFQNLKPGKAVGPDSIPTWILKLCSTQLAPRSTQLVLLADEIFNAMDSHYQVDLILLDFSTLLHTKNC